MNNYIGGMKLVMKWVRRGGYSAIWLVGATLLTKAIGVLQKIPLQNIGGEAVFGLYNMVYPIYQLLMTLAVAGLPTAVSFFIAKESNKHVQQRLLYASLMLLVILSTLLAAVTFLASNNLARAIGNEQLSVIIKVMSAALLFTPLLAGYRGFYQGTQLASISSLSQLIEQVIRVLTMILILWVGVGSNWHEVHIVAGVMWGASLGAIATICWLIYIQRKATIAYKQSGISWRLVGKDMLNLLKKSVPAAIAATIVPLIALVDSFTIPKLLQDMSYEFNDIAVQFGLYSRIQPLTQLVSMLFAAVIAGLIPNIVSSKQANVYDSWRLTKQAYLIHWYTFMIGAAASIGLYMLAEPINFMLYKNNEGIELFYWLSITALPSCLLAIQAPLMQLIGRFRWPLWIVAGSAIGKILLNQWLVPIYGIEGAAIAANITLYTAAIVGYIVIGLSYLKERKSFTLSKSTGKKWASLQSIFVFLLALLIMYLSIHILNEMFTYMGSLFKQSRLIITLYTIVAVTLGAASFGAVMILLKGVRKEEWQQIKWKS